MTAKTLDMRLEWRGTGVDECAVNVATGRVVVKVNPTLFRPAEVELLVGCPDKAKKVLGWEAATSLEQLCALVVKADLERNR